MFPERQELASDPILAMAIGFYNIYRQIWAMIKWRKILMHCKNTNFIYHVEFNKYMKIDKATLEGVFDCFFDIAAEKFLSEKERNIYMIYLRNEIWSNLNSTKNLKIIWKMMDLKTLLEMKTCRISIWTTSLVSFKYSKKL